MTTGRLRGAQPSAPEILPGEGSRGLADLLGAREYATVTIPRTTIRGSMRLLSRIEISQVRASARAALAERGITIGLQELALPDTQDEWNCEVAARTLAVAVRDPSNTLMPLDAVEEWLECDDDQIAALYEQYKDMAARLDPLSGRDVAPAVWAAIDDAAKKKDVAILISYGSQNLSLYIASLADRPAS